MNSSAPSPATGSALDVNALRMALRRVASTVHVAALRGDDGAFFATTATAVTSVSFEPPTLLVCLSRNGTMAEQVSIGRTMTISVLGAEQREVAQACAGKRPQAERESLFRVHDAAPHAMVVADAQASFVCKVAGVTEWGTHRVVFGEVVSAESRAAVDPLVYLDGNYRTVAPLEPSTK